MLKSRLATREWDKGVYLKEKERGAHRTPLRITAMRGVRNSEMEIKVLEKQKFQQGINSSSTGSPWKA